MLANSYPGVYELKCTCNSAYFGETNPKTIARENDYRKRKIPELLETTKVKYNKKIKVLN